MAAPPTEAGLNLPELMLHFSGLALVPALHGALISIALLIVASTKAE